MSLNWEVTVMQVAIRARKIQVDEALRAHVNRRLRFALSRFGERIAKVTVRFEDANGDRGGVDKQCQIDVALRPAGNVLIEDIDADLRTVVDRAANRAARAVHRDLQRRQDASGGGPHTQLTRVRRGHFDASNSGARKQRSEDTRS